jgi:hypothetical protein
MKTIKTIILLSSCLSISNYVAAFELAPDIKKCAIIDNSAKRLQCFDEYIQNYSPVKEEMTFSNNVKNTGDTSTKQEQPTPIVIVATKEQTEEKLISSFGQAHRYSEKEREFDEMSSVVKSAKRNLHKKWKIELQNGQVWIEKGGDKLAKFKEGDSIVVMRGIMNSFQLKKVGTKRRIRVRRIL